MTDVMDEKATSMVSRIIEHVRNRERGQDWTDNPWTVYLLDPKGYQELLRNLLRDESLWGFAKHKLRYKQP
jgi:hypothetical protein